VSVTNTSSPSNNTNRTSTQNETRNDKNKRDTSSASDLVSTPLALLTMAPLYSWLLN
jgi:hypothetical protein